MLNREALCSLMDKEEQQSRGSGSRGTKESKAEADLKRSLSSISVLLWLAMEMFLWIAFARSL
jgi:hypothetical protein